MDHFLNVHVHQLPLVTRVKSIYTFEILPNTKQRAIRFLPDEGPTLEMLDYTIHIGSTPTFLYFDLYLNTAYAAHYVYFTCCTVVQYSSSA